MALRATFIVDPDNVIQHVSVNNLNVGRNPEEMLRILDGLQTDELCPCNRDVGGDDAESSVKRSYRVRPAASERRSTRVGPSPCRARRARCPSERRHSWNSSTTSRSRIPDYAKDIRLNLDATIARSSLPQRDAVGAALAAAFAARSQVDRRRDPRQRRARRDGHRRGALTAAALMGMNNVWYPYVEMADDAGAQDACAPSCA